MSRGWAKLPNPFSEKKVRIGGLTIELKFKRDLTATKPDEDAERSQATPDSEYLNWCDRNAPPHAPLRRARKLTMTLLKLLIDSVMWEVGEAG